MPEKTFHLRLKSDSSAPPVIDGQTIENEILLGLPARELDAILPQLTFVDLRTHDVLHEPGEPIKFGYFLNKGMISILTVLTEGKSVEVGLTGKDGFVGLPLLVGFSGQRFQNRRAWNDADCAAISGSGQPVAALCTSSGHAGDAGCGLQSAARG